MSARAPRKAGVNGHAHVITLTDGVVTWECAVPACPFTASEPVGRDGVQRLASRWNAHVRLARPPVA
jgi:hypothetical protein